MANQEKLYSSPQMLTEELHQPEPEDAAVNLQKIMRSDVIKLFYVSKSDWEGAKQVALHFSALVISGTSMWILNEHSILWTMALLIHGFLLSFLFMGLHENVHGTAFRSTQLSRMFQNLFGFLSFRPPTHYYYYHWAHHRHTGDKNKDPELFNSLIDMDINNSFKYFVYLSGIPFWIDRFATLFRHFFGVYYNEPNDIEYYFKSDLSQSRCTMEARKYVLIYSALVLIGCLKPPIGSLLFYYWLLPSFVGQPHLRFYLLAEHQGCAADSSHIFDNTRNTSTLWLYVRLAWCMPYHATHHAWPGVPFHRLKEATSLYLVSQGDKKGIKSKCTPSGDDGYVLFNYNFIDTLKTERENKNKY